VPRRHIRNRWRTAGIPLASTPPPSRKRTEVHESAVLHHRDFGRPFVYFRPSFALAPLSHFAQSREIASNAAASPHKQNR
jgi:hypothetical protein